MEHLEVIVWGCERYALVLCRVEEAYLDAYEGEGWRGANHEKLRPTAELEQARLQVPF